MRIPHAPLVMCNASANLSYSAGTQPHTSYK